MKISQIIVETSTTAEISRNGGTAYEQYVDCLWVYFRSVTYCYLKD
jgi:hypothetical protein